MTDGGLIPLGSPGLRLLTAPIDRLQHMPHVAGMVGYLSDPLNDGGNSSQRPELGGVPEGRGTVEERPLHPLALRGGEARFRPRPPAAFEAIRAPALPGRMPLASRLTAHREGSGDFCLGLTFGKELRGLEPPALPRRSIPMG